MTVTTSKFYLRIIATKHNTRCLFPLWCEHQLVISIKGRLIWEWPRALLPLNANSQCFPPGCFTVSVPLQQENWPVQQTFAKFWLLQQSMEESDQTFWANVTSRQLYKFIVPIDIWQLRCLLNRITCSQTPKSPHHFRSQFSIFHPHGCVHLQHFLRQEVMIPLQQKKPWAESWHSYDYGMFP